MSLPDIFISMLLSRQICVFRVHVTFGFLTLVYLEVVFLGFRVNFIRNFAVQSYSAWFLVKPSPPNFVRPLLFSYFMSSNLHMYLWDVLWHLSWLFAKGPKTISELTPFSSQFPNILYVAVKLKHVNSKTVLGPFANNLLISAITKRLTNTCKFELMK
jgi:hypothetical protein